MSIEIERKFVVRENGIIYVTRVGTELLKKCISVDKFKVVQSYLPIEGKAKEFARDLNIWLDSDTEELRIRDSMGEYWFTCKGKGSLARAEKECQINEEIYSELLKLKVKGLEKDRLIVPREISPLVKINFDYYLDRDLITAEVELINNDESNLFSKFILGKDVTENKEYKNKNLAK